MRIALLHPTSHPHRQGPGERYLHDLARFLDAQGHEVTILTGASPFRQVPDGRVRIVPLALKGSKGRPGVLAATWLLRHRQDVVHGLAPGLVMAGVVTGHPTCFVAIGPAADDHERPDRWRQAVRAATGVAVLGDEVGSLVEEAGSTSPVFAVPPVNHPHDSCMVDQAATAPTLVYGLPSNGEDLVDAWGSVCTAFERLRRDVRDVALLAPEAVASGSTTRAVPPGVRLLPRLLRSQPSTCLPAPARVAVIPAGAYASIRVLEALGCGVPVVAPDTPGIVDLVTPAVGSRYLSGDSDAMAAAMAQALELADQSGTAEACRDAARAVAQRAPAAWARVHDTLARHTARHAASSMVALARRS